MDAPRAAGCDQPLLYRPQSFASHHFICPRDISTRVAGYWLLFRGPSPILDVVRSFSRWRRAVAMYRGLVTGESKRRQRWPRATLTIRRRECVKLLLPSNRQTGPRPRTLQKQLLGWRSAKAERRARCCSVVRLGGRGRSGLGFGAPFISRATPMFRWPRFLTSALASSTRPRPRSHRCLLALEPLEERVRSLSSQ